MSIGRSALTALEDGASGRVLAVFPRSLYVEMDAGRLACLGGLKLGDGPLNARATVPTHLNFETHGPAPGDSAHVDSDILDIDGKHKFALTGATEWAPDRSSIPLSGDISRGLDALRRGISSFDHDIGLGASISGIAPRQTEDRHLLDRAQPAINALTAWIGAAVRTRDVADPVPEDASGLIGLGPGLTPSGDDWIGGAMIALQIVDENDAGTALARWVMPNAQQRTGKISVAHLAAAAGGEGSAVLHDILGALVRGEEATVDRLLSRIDAIGHSSGWDALAGAVAVMEIVSTRPHSV